MLSSGRSERRIVDPHGAGCELSGIEPPRKLEDDLAALHTSSFGWAVSCCNRDASQAADVLQEVYFKVLSGKARFEGRSSLRTWLFGVIRLTAMEQRRILSLRWLRSSRSSGDRETPPSTDDVAAEGPSPSESLADRERAALLEKALLKLAPRQREVLHLTFYEGMTLADAAQVMDVSVGTASQHYDRGKAKLHEILTAEGGLR
jgi:RNA polymerase sigma-70 factor (ECF subfamily)